ncbi:cache domain-containing protein [Candidatus Sumerlaeota bacterium]|nr:cache domain-containing protein [Candidatus Sumerlaeota bacterium]
MSVKKTISGTIFRHLMILVLILVVPLGAFWIAGSYLASMSDIREEESRLLDDQRVRLKNQVSQVIEYIEDKKSLLDSRLRMVVHERTIEAHAVATRLYEEYRDKKSVGEIQETIRETLRAIRFNDGRGYYFIVGLDGLGQLSAHRPDIEGRYVLALPDARGDFVVRDMIDIVRKDDEGYYRHVWTKPDSTGNDHEKLTYVKRFAPFDWLIGTGEYVEDVEDDLKTECLEWIDRMQPSKEGRVFVVRWDGSNLTGADKGREAAIPVDADGVDVAQEFVDLARADGGFLSYAEPGTEEGEPPRPRICYVEGVADWQWYVGAAAYTSEVLVEMRDKRTEAMEKAKGRIGQIVLFLLVVFLAGQLSARHVSRRMKREFETFLTFFGRAASELAEIDPERTGFSEFEHLALSANWMILERRHAEEALKSSEERLKLAINALKHGIWDFNLETGKIHYTPRWFAILGYEPDELPQSYNTWLTHLHPDDREEFERHMREHMEGGDPFSLEYRMRKRDGKWTWILSRGQCVERDSEGKPRRLVGTNADVTPRKTAEIALRDSTEYFRTLISNISDVISIVDERFFVTYTSPNTERHFGWAPKDLIGKEGWATVHPSDLASVRERIDRILSAPEAGPRTFQYRYLRKDGDYADIEITAVNMIDNPLVRGILMNYRDISQRKRTAEALAQSEKRYRSLVDFLPVGLAVATIEDGKLQYANKRCEEICGWTKETAPDRDAFEQHVFPDPKIRKEIHDRMSADVASGDPERMRWSELPIARSDGKTAFVSAQVILLPDMGIVMLIFWDETDRKHAQDALRESEEQVRLLLDSTAEAIFGLDLSGRCTMANPSCVRLLGYASREDLLGREMHDLIHHSYSDGSPYLPHLCPILAALANGQSCHVADEVLWRADGTCFPAEYWSHPVRRDGKVVGCVVTFLDITERLMAEEERRDLESRLRHSQKMEAVGQLAGGIAHDFNNLLQVIAGYADLASHMLTPGQPPETEIQEVLKAAQRATTLVRQLLAFSRLEMLHLEYLNLNDLVGGTAKMLRRLIGENIELVTSPGYELRTVYADPGLIEQVLVNLCVNARDALPEGGRITIETENIVPGSDFALAHPEAGTRGYVMLSVSDTGIGIAPELQERVFEPFFTTKEVGRGTGLGLATVYGIVKQHDGHVEFESTPGYGTAFRIYLPAASETLVSPSSTRAPSQTHGGSETILLAEDDAMVSQLAQAVLERAGYRVLVARDGSQAVAAFDEDPNAVDLALLDVVMPRMSGRAVADRIRARRADLPIVFCSGYDFNVLAASLTEGEAHPLLRKPYSPSDLLAAVRDALGSGQ